MAGVTQPLLLAKEEDVTAKRSKLTEDNKFCHEQVNMSFPLCYINIIFILPYLLLLLVVLEAPTIRVHAVEM